MKNININLIFEWLWLSNYNISYKYINSFFAIFTGATFIYIICLISLIAILIYKLVKLSNKINHIKEKGLSKIYDRCLFEQVYLKFGLAILVPSLIFIIKLYSTLQFSHFAIVSLILLTVFGIIGVIVIDLVFNVVEFMVNVNEALDEYLNIMNKQGEKIKTTKSFVFNILGRGKMSYSNLFNRAYSTGPNLDNREEILNPVISKRKAKLNVVNKNTVCLLDKIDKVKLPELDDDINVNSEVFEEIISIINKEFLEHRKIIGDKRPKIFKNVILNEDYSVETDEFINSFKNLLTNKGILNEWARLDYKAKTKVLERWWYENINSSLEKRSEIFTDQSVFYKIQRHK